jgi:hypothetical protein
MEALDFGTAGIAAAAAPIFRWKSGKIKSDKYSQHAAAATTAGRENKGKGKS